MFRALKRAFVVLRQLKRFGVHELVAHRLPFGAKLILVLLGPTDRTWQAKPMGERIRACLESLGPIFVKFGQLLSTRPDLIPHDIAQQLAYLQDKVTPYPGPLFLARVEQSLQRPLDEMFAEVEKEPLASASVAQVHRATLLDGTQVVIKCLRPDLGSVIDDDIALMHWLARKALQWLPDAKRLRPTEVVSEYQLTIARELDLRIEAGNASLFRRNAQQKGLLYLPEVYWDYCTEAVMVSEYIDGIPVNDMAQIAAQNTNLKILAERGVEIFFTQVFEENFFHADMHPGNIFVSREHPSDPTYMAVDCAIAGSLSREDQYYLARNLLAIFRRDYRQVAELHIDSGWVPATTRVGDFETTIRSVCEPIFEKPLGEISFGNVLVNLFQTARQFDMQVQPQLVLLQKTLLNIEGMGRQLYPQLDIWATAHPFLENWLKDRFKPTTLWQELKRYGPDWLEKFPQVPNLLFDAIQQAAKPSGTVVEAKQVDRKPVRRRTLGSVSLVVGIAAGVSAGVAWPELLNRETALVCGGLAIGWVIARLSRA
ncbi:ubiquinone biosynthesis regulatory protein kinase UbiB [Umboniibacter marinipuniceus]|uniref:2-octaprenylphenol hydroxylase n=1 Tax=Umboniibacter marinipuniceus TaxID=569599 RepID=A0A3M0AD00_9GAMM|nr:ubiquinone biosynthesis regulatory protein kinase UbiB [Umboniibacter marinipuniceus]RMA82347.1 2-octaprenylphenol hydroxylase [Umboniibacter marinipuniceus]